MLFILGVSSESKEVHLENKSYEPTDKIVNETTATVHSNKRGSDTIDHQNSEAIQSIIAASNIPECTKTPNQINSTSTLSKKPEVNKCLNINTNTGDIILFDGNLDNFVKSTSTPNTNNNLLMIQPKPSLNTNKEQPIKNILNKPYLLPANNINVVNSNFETTAQITEQDIIKMPTVILCENRVVNTLNPLFVPSKFRCLNFLGDL